MSQIARHNLNSNTQRKTVQRLRELNLGFVLTVKGSQPALLQHLRAAVA